MARFFLTMALVLAAAAAPADLVRERWGGRKAPCSHPNTLGVKHTKTGDRLVFDLSALPDGAKVHHASLICFTDRGRQPNQPAQILAGKKELELEPPWYRSFDATVAVRAWAKDPSANDGFLVRQFEHFLPNRTCLDILYEGKAARPPEQVAGLRTVHHHGQTFIVFREHSSYRPKPDQVIWVKKFYERGDTLADGPGKDGAYGMPHHPGITLRTLRHLQGLGLRDKKSGFQGIKGLKRVRDVLPVTYQVYRHTERITADNIHHAKMLARVQPLSGYDKEVYKIHFRGEYLNQREEPDSAIPTYCVDKGRHLAPGEALYVHTPAKAGKAYYAVTMAVAGTENLSQLGDANSLADPVAETPGTPQPVLQWVQQDNYRKDPPEYWYRYWAAPPYCNLPCRSFRVAVAASDKFKGPGPLVIGTISGSFNVRGSIRLPRMNRIEIRIQRQLAWLPALFYNEGRDTLRGMTACKVDYFSERYMLFMVNWIMNRYKIDRSQITGGLLHFGLRHPEIFVRMQMGTYTAGYDLRWAPGGPSMPRVLGPRGIKTVRGEDAWNMYSVGEYVNAHPDRDIPYLICISGTGKDRGHTSEFGWQDDPRGWRGLLQARQPFVASWSSGPPRELSRALGDMRWDQTLPAFSNCSLDNNPGNGAPADGDYYGCINGWLLWDDKTAVDKKDTWEMTVYVIASCPESECTADVTPRRCEQFQPKAGQTFEWTNTSLAGDKVLQKGKVTADRWGLVTLKGLKLDKARNRLKITRIP
jgi:hypothetical protein